MNNLIIMVALFTTFPTYAVKIKNREAAKKFESERFEYKLLKTKEAKKFVKYVAGTPEDREYNKAMLEGGLPNKAVLFGMFAGMGLVNGLFKSGLMRKPPVLSYRIRSKETEEDIGYVLVANHKGSKEPEIGIFIRRGNGGKGIGTESTKAILKHIHDNIDYEKLHWRCHKDNIGSQKLAEKCGFEKVHQDDESLYYVEKCAVQEDETKE